MDEKRHWGEDVVELGTLCSVAQIVTSFSMMWEGPSLETL